MEISLVSLANAFTSRPSPFKPKYLTGMSWLNQQGWFEPLWAGLFLDDVTSAQFATYLAAQVVKLTPKLVWQAGDPNKPAGSNVSLANFLAWPSQGDSNLSIIQASDIASYIGLGICYGNMTWAESMELILSAMIPDSVLSQATQEAFNRDVVAQGQFSTVVATQKAIYKPNPA